MFLRTGKLAFPGRDGITTECNKTKMNITEYIKKVGKKKINEDLNIPISTIAKWEKLEKSPRPMTAARLIEYSRGILSWASIYAPYVEAQGGKDEN